MIPGLGRSPAGGHDHPLQYSCLENPPGHKSLAVHGVATSQTRLSDHQSKYSIVTDFHVMAHTVESEWTVLGALLRQQKCLCGVGTAEMSVEK